ncbi:hypothetical protein BDZ89DRAFT_63587 [Hymenopellis radicata]|nr:hypothetical protein BDZ89DRAFT_63587 [Hymenopellis radicata]
MCIAQQLPKPLIRVAASFFLCIRSLVVLSFRCCILLYLSSYTHAVSFSWMFCYYAFHGHLCEMRALLLVVSYQHSFYAFLSSVIIVSARNVVRTF